MALVAASGFGLLVGLLEFATRRNSGIRQLLPVLSAFLVTYVAFTLGRLPKTPAAQVILAPGFWLLVPSSVGLIGIAELAGGQGSNAIVVMLVSMMSIALGFATGLALWSAIMRRGDANLDY